MRVTDGGAVTHRLALPADRYAFACMFGGEACNQLYVCTAEAYRGGAVEMQR